MADAGSIITAFVKEFDAPSPDAEKLAAYFTDDAVYHNIPFDPVNGREAIKKTLAGMGTSMQSRGWEIKHQVASGDVVMNERVDRFTINGKAIALPVAGVFRLRDGKISEWRDYFDLAMWQKQQA
jgi:limonene-1,2-epoxide hydrolase